MKIEKKMWFTLLKGDWMGDYTTLYRINNKDNAIEPKNIAFPTFLLISMYETT